MTFGLLTPLALVALTLTGLVLWLHARRKRRMVVPSLRLWRDLQIPSGAARSTRKLPPFSWPLLLQLLAVIFAAFALAQPFFGEKPSKDQVFIIDPAAPLAPQQAHIANVLASPLAPHSLSLIAAGEAPKLLVAKLAPHEINLDDLFAQIPLSPQSDWDGVQRRLDMLALNEDAQQILLSANPLPADLAARGVQRQPIEAGPAQTEILLAVRPMQTAYRFAITVEAKLPEGVSESEMVVGYSDGQSDLAPLPFLEQVLRANAQGKVSYNGDVRLPGPGILSVIIDGIERARYLTEKPITEDAILYLGSGEQPLLGALRAVESVALYQADSLPSDLSPYKMVIIDGIDLPEAPALPTLWIAAASEEPLPQSDPDSWDQSHPLLANLDIKTLFPGEASPLTLPETAQVLLSAKNAPLIATDESQGHAQAWLAFNPAQSNWPNTPELAIFAAALHDFLIPDAPLAACTREDPCYPDNRAIGNLSETIEVADVLAPSIAPMSLMHIALALALLAIATDTVLAMRGYKRLTAPAPLSLAAIALLLLALFNTPLPRPMAGSTLIAVDVPKSSTSTDWSLNEVSLLSGDPPTLAPSGPAESSRLRSGSEALELAAASIPQGHNGHILLGGPLPRRPDALPNNLPVSFLAPPAPLANEVVLRAMELTGHPLEGEPLPVTLRVHAVTATTAELILRLNGEELVRSQLDIDAGDSRIETLLPALPEGEAFAEAELILPADLADLAENNTAGLIINATDPRPIAVISPDAAHGNAFAQLLREQGLEADVLYPDETPDYMRDWMRYGGIVLLNTPSIELLPHRQRMIQTMVNDYGLGLLILGGKNTFGPGGYYETPLEELSPVSARVPRESPEVAMVFVLDRSGSMQQPVGDGNRLSLAKRATVSSLEHLNPQSQIGVVTFDAEANVVYPLQTFDTAAIEAALDKVDPGGGTSIYPGLVEAYDMLKTSDSPAKHVIVMTDGLSQPGDWGGILRLMGEEGITVSGVAIGFGADVDAVKTIARYGRGAAHVSSDFAALPSILSQEAMMFASPVEETPSQPRWTGVSAPFLADLPARLPPLGGFVLTTPKPEANTAILTQDADGNDMPVLAWWRVGNGQVLAFTSDATGDWTSAWHGLDSYGPLFANALRAFHPPLPPTGLTLDLQPTGEAITITLSALSREGLPMTTLTPRAEVSYCSSADTCTLHQTVALTYEAPGIYSGRFLPEGAGRYDVTLSESSIAEVPLALGETAPANPRLAYHLAWPESLDTTRGNDTAEWLATRTGGSETTLDALRAQSAKTIWSALPATSPWAIAALALFMLELIRRYAELTLFTRRSSKARRAKEGQTQ